MDFATILATLLNAILMAEIAVNHQTEPYWANFVRSAFVMKWNEAKVPFFFLCHFTISTKDGELQIWPAKNEHLGILATTLCRFLFNLYYTHDILFGP